MSRLTVAGIGPGEADYILPAVIKKMKKSRGSLKRNRGFRTLYVYTTKKEKSCNISIRRGSWRWRN